MILLRNVIICTRLFTATLIKYNYLVMIVQCDIRSYTHTTCVMSAQEEATNYTKQSHLFYFVVFFEDTHWPS